MRKELAKKTMAAALAATMVLGNGLMVSAADASDTQGAVTFEGSVDGLINLEVVKVELATDADASFKFILDPQGLIEKSLSTGTAKAEYMGEVTDKDGNEVSKFKDGYSTLYFKNLQNGKTAATAKEEGKAESSNSGVKITYDNKDLIETGAYVWKEATDKVYVKRSATSSAIDEYALSDADIGKTAGWYPADASFGSTTEGLADVASVPTPVTTFAGITLDTSTATLASGDTLTLTAKVDAKEAQAATYTYSAVSDLIEVQNKCFVPLNIQLNVEVKSLADGISTAGTKADATAAKTPTLYLDVVDATDTTKSKGAIQAKTTSTAIFDVITKNDINDFDAEYKLSADGKSGAYSLVPQSSTEYEKYSFKITGATSTTGWTTALANTQPQLAITYKVQKKADTATATLGADGKMTLAGLTKDATVAGIKLVSATGYATLSADSLKLLEKQKARLVLTLTDGSTAVSDEITFPEVPTTTGD